MSADSPSPSPTSDIPEDAVAAYQRDISLALSAAPSADFVDPHLTDASETDPDDVEARSLESDVDPVTRFGAGPTEAELLAGEAVSPSEASPAEPGGNIEAEPDAAASESLDTSNDLAETPAQAAPSPATAINELAGQLRAANPNLSEEAAHDLAAKPSPIRP